MAITYKYFFQKLPPLCLKTELMDKIQYGKNSCIISAKYFSYKVFVYIIYWLSTKDFPVCCKDQGDVSKWKKSFFLLS